jgi:hypothetical protein
LVKIFKPFAESFYATITVCVSRIFVKKMDARGGIKLEKDINLGADIVFTNP